MKSKFCRRFGFPELIPDYFLDIELRTTERQSRETGFENFSERNKKCFEFLWEKGSNLVLDDEHKKFVFNHTRQDLSGRERGKATWFGGYDNGELFANICKPGSDHLTTVLAEFGWNTFWNSITPTIITHLSRRWKCQIKRSHNVWAMAINQKKFEDLRYSLRLLHDMRLKLKHYPEKDTFDSIFPFCGEINEGNLMLEDEIFFVGKGELNTYDDEDELTTFFDLSDSLYVFAESSIWTRDEYA
jgi:hypothetical protein